MWGTRYGDTSTITVHVRRLREKVEPDPANPARIATVWGVGYRWEGVDSRPAVAVLVGLSAAAVAAAAAGLPGADAVQLVGLSFGVALAAYGLGRAALRRWGVGAQGASLAACVPALPPRSSYWRSSETSS